MPLANIKRRESAPGQRIAKLKRNEQKTVRLLYRSIGQGYLDFDVAGVSVFPKHILLCPREAVTYCYAW